MRNLSAFIAGVMVAGSLMSTGNHIASGADAPNIVLIMIDDLGWKDVSCYGNDMIDTPHIDQLAANGVRFTDFYAAGAVCSPTRAALQSGQNQARVGITAHIPGHWRPFERVITPMTTMALPTDIVTVAETLKTADYKTGYIGKWHLGNGPAFQPDRQGYDISQVINGPHLPGRYRIAGSGSTVTPKKGQYRTDFEADLAGDFIRQHKAEPFFLMVSPFAVHIPLGAMSDKVEKYRRRAKELGRELPHPIYAAMVEHCDDMVGRIVSVLEEQSLSDKTMVIFTSDNGGLYTRYDYRPEADDRVSSQAPLKGEKGSLHEGGVRVPLIIKYPPRAKAGSICAEPTISYDFYPTLAELAGASLPANQTIDGMSLLPLLDSPESRLERGALHWHYPHYHHDRPASSIRERDWKLIEYLDGTGDTELYHLSEDLGETTNLAAEKPGRLSDLKRKLARWREQVVAAVPISNPSYDPDRADEWWSRRSGKPVNSGTRKRFPPTEKDD